MENKVVVLDSGTYTLRVKKVVFLEEGGDLKGICLVRVNNLFVFNVKIVEWKNGNLYGSIPQIGKHVPYWIVDEILRKEIMCLAVSAFKDFQLKELKKNRINLGDL